MLESTLGKLVVCAQCEQNPLQGGYGLWNLGPDQPGEGRCSPWKGCLGNRKNLGARSPHGPRSLGPAGGQPPGAAQSAVGLSAGTAVWRPCSSCDSP